MQTQPLDHALRVCAAIAAARAARGDDHVSLSFFGLPQEVVDLLLPLLGLPTGRSRVESETHSWDQWHGFVGGEDGGVVSGVGVTLCVTIEKKEAVSV